LSAGFGVDSTGAAAGVESGVEVDPEPDVCAGGGVGACARIVAGIAARAAHPQIIASARKRRPRTSRPARRFPSRCCAQLDMFTKPLI
jgi:hypothetical protein